MPDYNALFHSNGPDEKVIESGAKLTVKSGGVLDLLTGAIVKANGTQAAAISAVPTGGSADAAANATAINSIITALIGAGIIAPS